jgi:hypothetical protein
MVPAHEQETRLSTNCFSATVAVISTVIFFVWVDGVTVRESPGRETARDHLAHE